MSVMKSVLFGLLAVMSVGCAPSSQQQFPFVGSDFVHYAESGCFGSCPAFDVYVFRDGLMLLRGYGAGFGSVEPLLIGDFVYQKEHELFLELVDRMNQQDFLALQADYGVVDNSLCSDVWTDHPSITIEKIEYNKRRIVIYNLGCKGFVGEQSLARIIEDLRNTLEVEKLIHTAKNDSAK
jgi:uncharacterized protein DUF6438